MIKYGAKLEVDETYVWAARWPDDASIPGDEVLLTALRYVDGDDVAMASIEKREKRTVFGSYTPKVELTSANVYTPLYMWGATDQVLSKAGFGAGFSLKIRSWLQGSTLTDPIPQIRGDLFPASKYVWLAYWPGAVPSNDGILTSLRRVANADASVLYVANNVVMGSFSPKENVSDTRVRNALTDIGARFVKVHSNADFPWADWQLDASEDLQNIDLPDAGRAFEWTKLALIGVGLYALLRLGDK